MSASHGRSSAIASAAPWPAPYAAPPPEAPLGLVAGVVDALPLALGVLDLHGSLFQWNDAFRLTTGFAGFPDGRPQCPATALVVPQDVAALTAAIGRAAAGGGLPETLRLRLSHRPVEAVDITVAPLPEGFGARAVMALRDIREQLRLERQVAQVTRMQSIGQLAGGVAHDFNNILTAVLGLCDQLLQRRTAASADVEDIEQIRLNAERAAALVRQLLAFARQQTLRPQSLDVNKVIVDLSALVERLAGPGVAVELNLGAELDPVLADPGQLEQVIVNLAVNARDAMEGQGQLAITTRRVPAAAVAALGHEVMPLTDYVEIAVSDTGTGIDPAIVARIFEPFFTTKEVGKGTGLGLATVYGIVKQTGGFVFVAPRPGSGSVFTLYFPAGGGHAAAAAPQSVQPAVPPATQVLLVEDDRAVRTIVDRALQRHGMVVEATADAAAALDVLQRDGAAFDILVSDIVMPGMDGLALLSAARALYPDLPAVLMSGYAEVPLRKAGGLSGAIFLAKPFAVGELLAAVSQALAAGAAGSRT